MSDRPLLFVYDRPADTECGLCGAPIWYVENAGDRYAMNHGGTAHAKTCKGASRFRNRSNPQPPRDAG